MESFKTKIKDLPKDIQEKAIEHAMNPDCRGESINPSAAKIKSLISAFSWFKSPEGGGYWADINKKYNPKPKDEMSEQGLRFNDGKRRWSLVDFKSIEPMVEVLEFGAKKYDDHNWKKGLKTTEVAESLMRHLFAFLSGEDNDSESGLSHIGHIQCNAMFLAYMMKNLPEMDTRHKIQKDE